MNEERMGQAVESKGFMRGGKKSRSVYICKYLYKPTFLLSPIRLTNKIER